MANEIIREFVGEGNQHKVERSITKHSWVIKQPKFRHSLFLKLLGMTPSKFRTELKDILKQTEYSNIKIPKTKLFNFQKGYLMSQEYISEDHSIEDIGKFLRAESTFLSNCYESNPSNFRSFEGTVYWIDPVIGNDARFFQHFGILSWETYINLKVKFKQYFRFFIFNK